MTVVDKFYNLPEKEQKKWRDESTSAQVELYELIHGEGVEGVDVEGGV